VAQWFKNHGDKNSTAITHNSTMDPLIFSIANQTVPVIGNSLKLSEITKKSELNIEKYLLGKYNRGDIIKDNVGYVVVEKDVSSMSYSILVYENKDYKIFEIN